MPACSEVTKLHPQTVANAEELAREGRRLRRRKPRPAPKSIANEEIIIIDAQVLATARRLADGDKSRLVLKADGSVIVANSRSHAQKISRWK